MHQVSNFHAHVGQQILSMVQTISDNLPRFHIYERLESDAVLQIALLNIFTDVVEFCLVVFGYLQRGTLGKSGCPSQAKLLTTEMIRQIGQNHSITGQRGADGGHRPSQNTYKDCRPHSCGNRASARL